MTWALDLDGVVWLGDKVIQGVGESITFLREKGEQVFFVTNNSGRTVSEVEEKLNSFTLDNKNKKEERKGKNEETDRQNIIKLGQTYYKENENGKKKKQ